MLSHLERAPRNRERRIAWLKYIEPLLTGVGLVLLAHFSRIFPLFLKWMHADDDETVKLVRNTFNLLLTFSIRFHKFTDEFFFSWVHNNMKFYHLG